MVFTRADYPMEDVPKMESGQISTTGGVRCKGQIIISFARSASIYCVENVRKKISLTAYRLYICITVVVKIIIQVKHF